MHRDMCSYDRSQMDAAELADLLSQVACFAPGQSFHMNGWRAAAHGGCNSDYHLGSTMSSANSSSSSAGGGSTTGACSTRQQLDPARLHSAVQRSLVCVAAFAEERHLPQHQRLAARGLAAAPEFSRQQQAQQQAGERSPGSWPRPRRTRRVLVGFARAVGDAALVATGVWLRDQQGPSRVAAAARATYSLATLPCPCLPSGSPLPPATRAA